MKTFTIENETNNITIHPTLQEAEAVTNADRFCAEAELARLAAEWPAARLVEIWNSLPGETPVKKFKDRATAVSRIWKAIQGIGSTVEVGTELEAETAEVISAIPAAEVCPEMIEVEAEIETVTQESESTPTATDPGVSAAPEADVTTPVAPQTPDIAPEAAPAEHKATRAKKAPKAADTSAPREGSKTSQVIAMLKREGGATLEEIMTAMGWQKHTTRAMLSAGGSLTRNHGLAVVSEKVGDKRVYSIKA
jgi:Protein of unknown function (DUF3489)